MAIYTAQNKKTTQQCLMKLIKMEYENVKRKQGMQPYKRKKNVHRLWVRK